MPNHIIVSSHNYFMLYLSKYGYDPFNNHNKVIEHEYNLFNK